MTYVGIDYHKKYSHVTAINEAGKVIYSKRLENRLESFQGFLGDFKVRAGRFWRRLEPGE